MDIAIRKFSKNVCGSMLTNPFETFMFLNWQTSFLNSLDSRVVRASASGAVDQGVKYCAPFCYHVLE